jgi:hypothetical protein
MTRLLARHLALLYLCVIGGTASAVPASAGHAAACVAALKGREALLTATLKGGAPVEPELFRVVRSGFTFIGRQYLAGVREAEARQLLEAAERDFAALAPDGRKLRQAECLREGEQLYSQSTAFERSLITSAAERRVKRMKSR